MQNAFKCVAHIKHKGKCVDFLCYAITSRALASLQRLTLSANMIGYEGMKALSTAIRTGQLGSCTLISLSYNNIGDVGMQAFSEAIRSGALGSCTFVNLMWNNIGNVGMQAFSDAIRRGALGKLERLLIDAPSQSLQDACSARNIKLNTFL